MLSFKLLDLTSYLNVRVVEALFDWQDLIGYVYKLYTNSLRGLEVIQKLRLGVQLCW